MTVTKRNENGSDVCYFDRYQISDACAGACTFDRTNQKFKTG